MWEKFFVTLSCVSVVINCYLIERTEFIVQRVNSYWLFNCSIGYNKWLHISIERPIAEHKVYIYNRHRIDTARYTTFERIDWGTIDLKCLNIKCALYLTQSGKFLQYLCVFFFMSSVPIAIVIDYTLNVTVWLQNLY